MLGSSSEPCSSQSPATEPIVRVIETRLVAMFGLRACWFEPFPFDVQLPRIEPGRIVLPAEEPGVASWSPGSGIELPVRHDDLTMGRFVLVPETPTTGVALAPSARAEAIAMATRVGALIAAAMIAESSGSRAPLLTARPDRDASPAEDHGVSASTPTPRRSRVRHLRRTTRRGRHFE